MRRSGGAGAVAQEDHRAGRVTLLPLGVFFAFLGICP
jgi:hypothetical protein